MKLLITLILALFLAGCSTTSLLQPVAGLSNTLDLDVKAGIALGTPALGANDNLVKCYVAIDKVVNAYGLADKADPNGKLFYDLMRLRIIQQITQQNSTTLQNECAAMAQEILMAIATRGASMRPNIQVPTLPQVPTVPPVGK